MTKATARHWAVMAAPLVELSLLAPEVRGSNPISDITEQFSTNFKTWLSRTYCWFRPWRCTFWTSLVWVCTTIFGHSVKRKRRNPSLTGPELRPEGPGSPSAEPGTELGVRYWPCCDNFCGRPLKQLVLSTSLNSTHMVEGTRALIGWSP